jgi:hypothetical protein
MQIQKEIVQEYFDSTSKMLEGNIDSALNRLRNQCLVLWSKEITVAVVIPAESDGKIVKYKFKDEYDEDIINYNYISNKNIYLEYREGTEEEKRFILGTEREILEKMNYDNKSQVIADGRWDEYTEKVENILLEKRNIAFYYKSYKILFNKEHIIQAAIKIDDFILLEIEETIEKNKLNNGVVDRIENNITNKHNRATKNENKSNIIKLRSAENYIENNQKLNDKLINKDAEDIRRVIRKTKIEEKNIPISESRVPF